MENVDSIATRNFENLFNSPIPCDQAPAIYIIILRFMSLFLRLLAVQRSQGPVSHKSLNSSGLFSGATIPFISLCHKNSYYLCSFVCRYLFCMQIFIFIHKNSYYLFFACKYLIVSFIIILISLGVLFVSLMLIVQFECIVFLKKRS